MLRKSDIYNEIEYLIKLEEKVKKELDKLKKSVPDEMGLKGRKHGEKYQYYVSTKNEKEKYIREKDRKLAQDLAQVEYYEKLLDLVEKELKEIHQLKSIPTKNLYIDAMEKLTVPKRALITLPYVTNEEFLENWRNQEYSRKGFAEDAPEYYSRKGLRVRSKSEVLIADLLDEMQIPFLYEKPVKITGMGVVHPDFTLLNLKERKEVYWEHFGMMDDIEYREKAYRKVKGYEGDKIYRGISLITTFETKRYPLNTKSLKMMLKYIKNQMGYLENSNMVQ
ncbi:MAG: hypothetical protein K6A30_02825 [Lachnospiraceae bacterium]|nr:hypothetical protein [Lachnospiraceae bacterium]